MREKQEKEFLKTKNSYTRVPLYNSQNMNSLYNILIKKPNGEEISLKEYQ